ncbi:MAG TPA: peptidase C25, partial [Thermoplasmatales archaeon]|nr:peptidase C25 [Thermoplasmatales archaeon]
KLIKENNAIEVHLEGVESYLLSPGKPMLPMIIKNIELPFGVKNIKISFKPGEIYNMPIDSKVAPTPLALPLSYDGIIPYYKDEMVYRSNKPYPAEWYQYRIGCGLNKNNEHVTFVSLHIFPVRYVPSKDMLEVLENADITIIYDQPDYNPFPETSQYDLVIIAPQVFSQALQPLIDHKNNMGVKTILKTTEEIYQEYQGRDKPEQIKYFIKDALEQWVIKYVLLVGGLKSMIYSKPRDDANQGSRDWYLPVRYTNLYDSPRFPLSEETIHDPGIISDLYYADIYREGGEFESWDHNNDGIFAAWGKPGVENDTGLDFYPDVALGRLACRSVDEVKTVVNKIIRYESTSLSDKPWFKKMIVVSGDGFLDQQDLNIKWDTNGLPDGEYTIYAQSINPEGEKGPIDVIHVTLDKTKPTNLTFNHDDHLNPALQNGYPAIPIAEIVSVSNGNTLGNTDYQYTPSEREAYCNEFYHWANISYIGGVLTIRGKSYDPRPYGNVTSIHVWVNNSNGETVFSDWRNNTEMYYEGEWTTGEKALYNRGGALYYMPDDFEKEILWTSNGKFKGQDDVINAIDQGSGFLFFSGHGSPNVWADHYPG